METMSVDRMIKLFEKLRYRHDMFTVFADFLEMSAISISNAVDLQHMKERESRYMEIVKKYDKKEMEIFPQILGELINSLDKHPSDVLGDIFMKLELSSSWHGQFFTPMSLANMFAELTISGYEKQIKKKGYFTLNEPACGGGATIIGMVNALEKRKLNYQACMRVVAQDIDAKAVHMCYLQLSLLGVDAVILQGDTLSYKFSDVWMTPNHILKWARSRKQVPDPKPQFEQLSLAL